MDIRQKVIEMDRSTKIKLVLTLILVAAMMFVVFFVVGINVKPPVLRGVEYKGFIADYENKEEDPCSTMMH